MVGVIVFAVPFAPSAHVFAELFWVASAENVFAFGESFGVDFFDLAIDYFGLWRERFSSHAPGLGLTIIKMFLLYHLTSG